MPEKPSRRRRRQETQRTGRRPERVDPHPPMDSAQATPARRPGASAIEQGDPLGVTDAAEESAQPAPPPRQSNLAPSAARAASYLQQRQREILHELRGLAIIWSIVIAIFVVAVVVLASL